MVYFLFFYFCSDRGPPIHQFLYALLFDEFLVFLYLVVCALALATPTLPLPLALVLLSLVPTSLRSVVVAAVVVVVPTRFYLLHYAVGGLGIRCLC